MSESNTVEFAGIELTEGDEITVDYETEFGVKNKSGVIESFTYVNSRFMPAHVVFGPHDDVCEEDVVEIEKVA